MSFKVVSCQDKVVRLFKDAIKKNRLAHAYIFAGQEGVGKTLFSKELAKMVFCKHPGSDACDNCNACRRIENNTYSDLFSILPEKNSKVIKIDQLKHLQDMLTIKPLESAHKMVIVQSADRMNEEASNCLLKTLEEPPFYAIILLLATSLDSVRDTIRSRCQIVRFAPLSDDTIKNILVNRYQINDKQAEQLASISQGSIKRAVLLSNTNTPEKRDWLIDQLLKSGLQDHLTFSKELFQEWHIQEIDVLEEKRLIIKELIFSILLYYRDLLVCKTGGSDIYNKGRKVALLSKSSSISEDALFRIIQAIKTSFEYLDRNANITLLVENMIAKIFYLQFNNALQSPS
ncbi:MAG: DNA polymerase III subunit delta' [Candidatus Loosdrechtia sp.]|uniref:DNA polymerase III subunit n=1 Tax=Candidatus Loosdrechtia sp. TaxID=3101272 RepID=UPI003A6741AF|nr:MAG: DNA polymerase III subunit delta' [Candidatus Jettenia sp. AMX2]